MGMEGILFVILAAILFAIGMFVTGNSGGAQPPAGSTASENLSAPRNN